MLLTRQPPQPALSHLGHNTPENDVVYCLTHSHSHLSKSFPPLFILAILNVSFLHIFTHQLLIALPRSETTTHPPSFLRFLM